MRDSLLNIPARISALVAAESDQNRCYRIINKELREVLDDYTSILNSIADKGEQPRKKK